MTRLSILRQCAIHVVLCAAPGAWAEGSTELRSKVPEWRAQYFAGSLFADRCGMKGENCTIKYDYRRKCAREFAIVFPGSDPGDGTLALEAWVTLDPTGKVANIVSVPGETCDGRSI